MNLLETLFSVFLLFSQKCKLLGIDCIDGFAVLASAVITLAKTKMILKF